MAETTKTFWCSHSCAFGKSPQFPEGGQGGSERKITVFQICGPKAHKDNIAMTMDRQGIESL